MIKNNPSWDRQTPSFKNLAELYSWILMVNYSLESGQSLAILRRISSQLDFTLQQALIKPSESLHSDQFEVIDKLVQKEIDQIL